MNRERFDRYLAAFNSRGYAEAKKYFADDILLKFAGYEISGIREFMDFYTFFHDYVDEKVIVRQFAGDEENVIIDVVVRLKGEKDLTEAILKEKGKERLGVLAKGEEREIPQFIHYRIEQGKFKEIRCIIKQDDL